MAAQIIPFPRLNAVNEGMAPLGTTAMQHTSAPSDPATHMHIVRPSAFGRSQQTAQRIVEDVCLEHHLTHPAFETNTERPAAFWATLPMPPARVETPISVAKRLAHMLLPVAEHA